MNASQDWDRIRDLFHESLELELLDVAGRRVRDRAVGTLVAGRHVVDLAGDQRLKHA